MTDDNSNLVDIDDLDAFEKDFYGNGDEAPQPEDEAKEEEVAETEDDALATDEDESEPDPENEDEDEDPEPEEDEKPQKKGKKSFQERINEVIAEAREAQRERDALVKRVAELEASRNEVKEEEKPKSLREQLPPEAPSPDAKDDNGEPVYPLGEFDPNYIRDLSKFTVAEEMKAARQAAEEEARVKAVEEARRELETQWLEKLEAVSEELPDYREKVAALDKAFEGLDPNYGEYLATTLMQSEFGPHIMYYLSQNIGEAQRIVASGPAAATLAIGRLEARFVKPKQEEKRNKKVSEAPTPPEARTRGAQGRFQTAPDTDDLDAFEKEFYKK